MLQMVGGLKTINKSLSTNSTLTRVMKIPIREHWILRRDNSRTTHYRITFIRCKTHFTQKQSLKYCAYILMKVHTLDIDSSERYTNVYLYANNYVVTLKEPIYDVTQITLVSARIPTPQLQICETNKTFSIDGVDITLEANNYTSGATMASELQRQLFPPSDIDQVTYDEYRNTMTFSNTGATNDFTFEFFDGTHGYVNGTNSTTPHQVFGFSSNNQSSSNYTLTSGAINLGGPNSIIIRLTSGSDEFTKTIYSKTPFYTGHILTNGSDVINYYHTNDPLKHEFYKGPQKFIRDVRVEFLYMSHGRLIPYDFRGQDHILKFEITGSTDKLEGLPKVPLEVVEKKLPPPISIPEVLVDSYRWKEYISIGVIVFIGFVLMLLMRRRPPPISE